jgi:MSHA biogenesis protein MshJ
VIKAQVNKLKQQVDALSMRERLILFGVIAVLSYMGVEHYLWIPLDEQQAIVQKKLLSTQQETQKFAKLTIDIRKGIDADPDKEDRQTLERINTQIINTDQQIAKAISGLIPPDMMALALEKLLQKQENIHFISMANLPAQPLEIAANSKSEDNSPLENPLAGVFRHNLEIIFEGSYQDVLGYLHELEGLEWRFRWNSIDMTMQEYPIVRVRLLLHTLSLERGLIGV